MKHIAVLLFVLLVSLGLVAACAPVSVPLASQPSVVPGQQGQIGTKTEAAQTAQAEAYKASAPVGVMATPTEPPPAPATAVHTPDASATRAAALTAQAEAYSAGAPQPTKEPAALLTAQAEAFSVGAPVPVPTQTPQPEVTIPSPASQQASMREELFLAGAPSFAMIDRCPMPDALSPGKLDATWTSTLDSGLLCLFGFDENETVRYEVRDAGGDLVVSDEGTPDNMDGDALPSVKVMLDLSGSAPGDWTVRAGGPSGDLSSTFAAQPQTLEGAPAVVLSFRGAPATLAVGGEATIIGYGLNPNGSASIGVYEVISGDASSSTLRLHEATTVPVDGTGTTAASLQLNPNYLAGEYCVILAASSAYVPSRELDPLGATRCFEVSVQ